MRNHTQAWLEFFVKNGYSDVKPLAAGVEGAVYRLGNGVVAKVWGRRQVAELARVQNFYADLAAAGLPFATPEILRIDDVDGIAVTYDRELYGQPLQERLSINDFRADPDAVNCVIDVLRALAMVSDTESMRQLPVIHERRPLWGTATGFLKC